MNRVDGGIVSSGHWRPGRHDEGHIVDADEGLEYGHEAFVRRLLDVMQRRRIPVDDVLGVGEHSVLVQVRPSSSPAFETRSVPVAFTAYIRAKATTSVAPVTDALPIACAISCAVPPP